MGQPCSSLNTETINVHKNPRASTCNSLRHRPTDAYTRLWLGLKLVAGTRCCRCLPLCSSQDTAGCLQNSSVLLLPSEINSKRPGTQRGRARASGCSASDLRVTKLWGFGRRKVASSCSLRALVSHCQSSVTSRAVSFVLSMPACSSRVPEVISRLLCSISWQR